MKKNETRKFIKYGQSGLDYVWIEVTLRESPRGPLVTTPLEAIERAVAVALLTKRVPIRGAEVAFLFGVLGLKVTALAKGLGVSTTTIRRWEAARDTQLGHAHEVAVRMFVAEKLDVPLEGRFSELIGKSQNPKRVRVAA